MLSSVIQNMVYDEVTATLRIIFLSGMIYDYQHVPSEEYRKMKKSTSKGKYLNKHIKGNYAFKKIFPN